MDISRLNKRIARLEKLVEINKNFDGAAGGRIQGGGVIPEQDEMLEDTNNFALPPNQYNTN